MTVRNHIIEIIKLTFVTAFIAAGVMTMTFTSCAHEENTENPSSSLPAVDKTPPTITLHRTSVDITGVEQISIVGSELRVGDILVASWKDNVTKSCQVKMMFEGTAISSGEVPEKSGTLTLTVTDDAGNAKSATVSLKMLESFPDLSILLPEVNVFGGTEVQITDTQLLIGGKLVASWSDKYSDKCTATLTLNGSEVKSGDTVSEPGTLVLTVTNGQGRSSSAEITLTNEALYGLENLRNASIQVDKEVNLLSGITFADGVELVKVEVEIEGKRYSVSDPYHYTPDYPGTMNVFFTVKGKNGTTAEIKVDNLTIKPLEYKAMTVTNIKPAEILPIVGQIDAGDKKAYEHIEHLGIVPAVRIRDMMWKYGAGEYSPEEYQKLMSRLNTGMVLENPKGYSNYQTIGGEVAEDPSEHAYNEWDILNTLVNHASFKVVNPMNRWVQAIQDYVNNNPNSICIFGQSSYADVDKENYLSRDNNLVKKLCKSKNFLIFVAGGNIRGIDGVLRNKIYHEDVEGDEHGVYGAPSTANGKNDNSADRHLIVTVGTNGIGDLDQTNEDVESSKFPVGFHNDVLFAGRTFPRHKLSNGQIVSDSGKYPTSYVNYVNVAVADILFQMKADVPDVPKLLEMIRSSTDLRDHIRFNGKDQPLILMNPAGFFKKYLMPIDLPAIVSMSNAAALEKGFYHGVVFDIPGAEVKVNGEWMTYEAKNKEAILAQNPMTLEWRLNGDLLRKYGYKQGDTVKGQLLVVDDQWNGLNITKDISIMIE